MGKVKNIHVLSQHIDPETGASVVAHPEEVVGGDPIPPIYARDHLPDFDRGLGLYNTNRDGHVHKLGVGKFEYIVDSTAAFHNKGVGIKYAGQIEMDDASTIASLSGGWCECHSFRKKQFRYQGAVVCKHMWWAAIVAACEEYEPVEQVEVHHRDGRLLAVKMGFCKLREPMRGTDMDSVLSWLENSGFKAHVWERSGSVDLPTDKSGSYARVYIR